MCHHSNSHTLRPRRNVENTATYDTNSQVRHKILGATSSSKKLNHSVKQSLLLSSSTCVFGSLVAWCGESGSVRFGGSNTNNGTHTMDMCSVHSHMSEENHYTNVSQEWVRFYWVRFYWACNAGSVWSPNVLCSFLKICSLRRLTLWPWNWTFKK